MGAALVGKALAALFAALAAGALFAAVARRHGPSEARWAGLTLALGTTLAAATHGLVGRGGRDVRRGGGGGAAGARGRGRPTPLPPRSPACRWAWPWRSSPRRRRWRWSWCSPCSRAFGSPACWCWRGPLPGVLMALGSLLADRAEPHASAAAPPGPAEAALALLASPAKGILCFAPAVVVALVGVVRALRAPEEPPLGPGAARPLPACRLSRRRDRAPRLRRDRGRLGPGPVLGPAARGARLAAAAAVPARGVRGAQAARDRARGRLDRRPGAGRR